VNWLVLSSVMNRKCGRHTRMVSKCVKSQAKAQFADLTDVSLAAVIRWKNGRRLPVNLSNHYRSARPSQDSLRVPSEHVQLLVKAQ
jgi:hypothetical protein